jgi:hypothetical protein
MTQDQIATIGLISSIVATIVVPITVGIYKAIKYVADNFNSINVEMLKHSKNMDLNISDIKKTNEMTQVVVQEVVKDIADISKEQKEQRVILNEHGTRISVLESKNE